MNGEFWTKPSWLIAAGLAIAATCWGLRYLVPAVGEGLGYLAAGAFYGVTLGGVGGWLTSLGTTCAGIVVAVSAIAVTRNVVQVAAKEKFSSIVAILAVLEGLVADFSQEFWPGNQFVRLLVKGSTALLIAVGAAVWVRKGWKNRLSAILLFLVMPVLVISAAVTPYLNDKDLSGALGMVKNETWLSLVAFGLTVLAVLVIGKVLEET
jgi:hypothetical protein